MGYWHFLFLSILLQLWPEIINTLPNHLPSKKPDPTHVAKSGRRLKVQMAKPVESETKT